MKKYLGPLIIALAFFSAVAMVFTLQYISTPRQSEAAGAALSGFLRYTTATSSQVTSSSALLVATNTARTYLRISNLSGNAIYCMPTYTFSTSSLQNSPAVGYSGITIFGSTTAEFFVDQNPYRGPLYCIAPLGTASTTILEI